MKIMSEQINLNEQSYYKVKLQLSEQSWLKNLIFSTLQNGLTIETTNCYIYTHAQNTGAIFCFL